MIHNSELDMVQNLAHSIWSNGKKKKKPTLFDCLLSCFWFYNYYSWVIIIIIIYKIILIKKVRINQRSKRAIEVGIGKMMMIVGMKWCKKKSVKMCSKRYQRPSIVFILYIEINITWLCRSVRSNWGVKMQKKGKGGEEGKKKKESLRRLLLAKQFSS